LIVDVVYVVARGDDVESQQRYFMTAGACSKSNISSGNTRLPWVVKLTAQLCLQSRKPGRGSARNENVLSREIERHDVDKRGSGPQKLTVLVRATDKIGNPLLFDSTR